MPKVELGPAMRAQRKPEPAPPPLAATSFQPHVPHSKEQMTLFSAQPAAPPPLLWPSPHAAHAAERARDAYLPAGHAAHAAAPRLNAKVPGAHGVSSVEPVAQDVRVEQSRQSLSLCWLVRFEKVPAGPVQREARHYAAASALLGSRALEPQARVHGSCADAPRGQ